VPKNGATHVPNFGIKYFYSEILSGHDCLCDSVHAPTPFKPVMMTPFSERNMNDPSILGALIGPFNILLISSIFGMTPKYVYLTLPLPYQL
jgi:hypothetical protein